MFTYMHYDEDNDSIYKADDNYEYSNIVMELTHKSDHKKLTYNQKYRDIKVINPENNCIYNYQFNLSTSDTGLADSILYEKDFYKLEYNEVYLFVCTIQAYKNNIIKDHPVIYEAKKENIYWHFLNVDSNADIISKHKGLIEKIDDNDFILAAGEIYRTKEKLIYNLQTGCIKESMFRNSENIKYDLEKKCIENPNCYLFYKKIFKPLIKSIDDTAIIDDYLRTTYGKKVTYEYLEELISRFPNIKYNRKLIK